MIERLPDVLIEPVVRFALAEDLGRDYIERRNDYIEAVTLEDVQRAAHRLLAGPLLFTVVGDPENLDG